MREILFRGKRVDNGEWIEGGVIPLDIESGYLFIAEPYLSASTLPVHEIVKNRTHLVIPETVGQYTGLVDKNGKKIFEGDIVDGTAGRGVVTFGTGTFDSGIYCYRGWYVKDEYSCVDHHELYIYNEYSEIEIIGNIHDNPELFKEDTNDEN